jgi:hypothetical protein
MKSPTAGRRPTGSVLADSDVPACFRQLVAERDLDLRAVVLQAWEIRHCAPAYLVDAVAAILQVWERAPLTMLERRQERQARLIRLLRETDPGRLVDQSDAA